MVRDGAAGLLVGTAPIGTDGRLDNEPGRSVWRLYQAYFQRHPDSDGFDFWLGQVGRGRSIESISEFFAASPEFESRFGAPSAGEFVGLVYGNVMCRRPDAEGRAYWIGRLDNGLSRGELMLFFSDSAEYRQRTNS